MDIPQPSSNPHSEGIAFACRIYCLDDLLLPDMGASPASFSASFDALVNSYHMSREQMNGLLEGLMMNDDDSTQLMCLQTVCDFLSIASEGRESIRGRKEENLHTE